MTCCPLPAGLLRLGAFWRQQSSLLHDPQQKLHDELVTLPPLGPATLVFFTLNIGRWGMEGWQEDGVCVCKCVCVRVFVDNLLLNGQLSIRRKLQECAHPTHTPPAAGGTTGPPRMVSLPAEQRWLLVLSADNASSSPAGRRLMWTCRVAFDLPVRLSGELHRGSKCSTSVTLHYSGVHTASAAAGGLACYSESWYCFLYCD